jgi:hypothetical protein
MVYLTTLSVAESMQHRMVERLVNGEVTGMWKGAVLVWYEVVSGIWRNWRKSRKVFSAVLFARPGFDMGISRVQVSRVSSWVSAQISYLSGRNVSYKDEKQCVPLLMQCQKYRETASTL